MRNALNSNPVVQAVVIGIMALVVAFLLFTRVLNGGEEAAPPPPTAAPASDAGAAATGAGAAPVAPAPAAGAPAASAPAPATTAPPAAAEAPAPSDAASAFVPGPGLPEEVVVAYARNDAVVLLITKDTGIDDRILTRSAKRVRNQKNVKFIPVPARDISRYARVTEGVDVTRVPAIVVIRPRKLTDNIPEATVSYGFRGPDSVEQAVEDALFDGKQATYDP